MTDPIDQPIDCPRCGESVPRPLERDAPGPRRRRTGRPGQRIPDGQRRQGLVRRRHQRGGAVLAGITVHVRQLAEREGVDCLGTLGPTLYAVAAEQPAGAILRDVTRGGNLFDNAGVGWDYATGLGSPRGAALARALVDHVKAFD